MKLGSPAAMRCEPLTREPDERPEAGEQPTETQLRAHAERLAGALRRLRDGWEHNLTEPMAEAMAALADYEQGRISNNAFAERPPAANAHNKTVATKTERQPKQ